MKVYRTICLSPALSKSDYLIDLIILNACTQHPSCFDFYATCDIFKGVIYISNSSPLCVTRKQVCRDKWLIGCHSYQPILNRTEFISINEFYIREFIHLTTPSLPQCYFIHHPKFLALRSTKRKYIECDEILNSLLYTIEILCKEYLFGKSNGRIF